MPPRGTAGAKGARARRASPAAGGHEEEGGSERWLVTYADMLTLLLVLFIVLFSISVVNTSKYISLKTSLAAVFGDGTKGMLSGGVGLEDEDQQGTGPQFVNPGSPMSVTTQPSGKDRQLRTGNGSTNGQLDKEVNNYHRIENAVNKALAAKNLKGAVKFAITSRGLVITVVTSALVFPGNSATLLSRGQQLLAAIGPALAKQPNNIEVDGYTNQLKVSTGPYPSGWELSSARASSVVRSLITYGVAENRLSAVGYSDQHPLLPPSNPRSVVVNRRVEIVALNDIPNEAGSQLVAAAKRYQHSQGKEKH